MDQSCLRRSQLIKQLHFVVWILLVAAGGVLASRVAFRSGPTVIVASANPPSLETAADATTPAEQTVTEPSEVTEQQTGPTTPRQDESSASAQAQTSTTKPSASDSPSPEPPPRKLASPPADTANARRPAENVPDVLELAEDTTTPDTPESVAPTSKTNVPTIAIGSVYEPEEPEASPTLERETAELPAELRTTTKMVSVETSRTTPAVTPPRRKSPQPTATNAPDLAAQAAKTPAANSLPPRTLSISNPKRIGYPVAFMYGGETVQLQPGDAFRRTFTEQKAKPSVVQFNRGGSFGDASMQLEPGDYEFKVTRQGWKLVPSDSRPSKKKTTVE